MRNYLQKLFLFFFISSSIYAMESNEYSNINAALVDAVIKSEPDNLDLQKIKEYIEQGADPNCKAENGASLVCVAVMYANVDLLKCLIQCKAKVDGKDDYPLFIPLQCAVDKLHYENGLEMVKELCKAGASLILRNFSPENKMTIFHHLGVYKAPKKTIETIITHARFYDQTADEQLKQTVKTALLVFNRLKKPKDIQFRILSNLVLDFSFGFNERFCKKLIEMNYNNFIFPYVEKRVENIDKILQLVDRNSMTSAQFWADVNRRTHNNNAQYAAQVQSLLDGSKLREDMRVFKNSFPNLEQIPKDNLVLAICDAQKLLNK